MIIAGIKRMRKHLMVIVRTVKYVFCKPLSERTIYYKGAFCPLTTNTYMVKPDPIYSKSYLDSLLSYKRIIRVHLKKTTALFGVLINIWKSERGEEWLFGLLAQCNPVPETVFQQRRTVRLPG